MASRTQHIIPPFPSTSDINNIPTTLVQPHLHSEYLQRIHEISTKELALRTRLKEISGLVPLAYDYMSLKPSGNLQDLMGRALWVLNQSLVASTLEQLISTGEGVIQFHFQPKCFKHVTKTLVELDKVIVEMFEAVNEFQRSVVVYAECFEEGMRRCDGIPERLLLDGSSAEEIRTLLSRHERAVGFNLKLASMEETNFRVWIGWVQEITLGVCLEVLKRTCEGRKVGTAELIIDSRDLSITLSNVSLIETSIVDAPPTKQNLVSGYVKQRHVQQKIDVGIIGD